MSAINTLIVEAKNKLDEIQEAVDRRPQEPANGQVIPTFQPWPFKAVRAPQGDYHPRVDNKTVGRDLAQFLYSAVPAGVYEGVRDFIDQKRGMPWKKLQADLEKAQSKVTELEEKNENLTAIVESKQAPALSKPTARKVLDKLVDVRKEVLVILGARPREGTRAAARRVMRQLTRALQKNVDLEAALKQARSTPPHPKPANGDLSTAVYVYNELEEAAHDAGFGRGGVLAYTAALRAGKRQKKAKVE